LQQRFQSHRFLGKLGLEVGTPPSQLVLFNRVSDYYYYGDRGLYFLPIGATLEAYLGGLGYEIVARYSLAEGLRFATEAMERRFREVTTGEARQISYGRRAAAAGVAEPQPASEPPVRAEQAPRQAVASLGRLLRQPDAPRTGVVRSAVVIERVQNVVSANPLPEERAIVDEIQSWSGITNGNVSILVADVARLEDLPESLAGAHRSGVALVDVGLPRAAEINELLISAETGSIVREFGERDTSDAATIRIDAEHRERVIGRLSGLDAVAIRRLVKDCGGRGIRELNLRTLRTVMTRTDDVWPELLDGEGLDHIRDMLRARVVGQDYPIDRIVNSLGAARDDLRQQVVTGQTVERPLRYFFFAGPTGVGKTEVFRALNEALPRVAARKFNMPEYKEEHSTARFFGAPPGYVGYGRGELGAFLIENPASVVLFDEFEKAHPSIWKNFLTMLEGGLTTGDGVRVDLTQAVFLFTSNAGADDLLDVAESLPEGERAFRRDENCRIVVGALRAAGAPTELVGRLEHAIVPFNHLDEATASGIVRLHLQALEKHNEVRFDGSVEDFLLDLYAEKKMFGARPITNHIQMSLKSEVLQLKAKGHLVYKDADGITRDAVDERAISSRYSRRSGGTA
jgi:predicted RNA-binding protein YlqC (UPF0109 family)